MNKQLKIAFAGGGTGGHLFPALNLADAMKERWNASIQFFGTKRGIENNKVPEAGYPLIRIPVAGFQRKLTLKNFSFPIKLWKSMQISTKALRNFDPHLVFGTGGYVMGPVLRSAVRLKIPVVIQEQNSYPGVTTRMLAGKADLVFTAYEESQRYLNNKNIVVSGNPIFYRPVNKERQVLMKKFGLSPDLKTILVFGGSQGAESVNRALADMISRSGVMPGYQILWQTGVQHFEHYSGMFEDQETSCVKTYPFIEDMPAAYSICSFAVCRAGAMTLSELAAYSVPAILVPYPHAAADHQYKNAMALHKKGGVKLIRDDQNLSDALEQSIRELTGAEDQLGEMRKAQRTSHNPDSIELIMNKTKALLKSKNQWPLGN